MATYYVSPTGSDAAAGTSEGTAWETVSKVNGETFSAGDSILFERDGVWREQLDIPSSGSTGNPITFGAYGTGDKPRITGAELVDGFSESSGESVLVDTSAETGTNGSNVGRDASNFWAVAEVAIAGGDRTINRCEISIREEGSLSGGDTVTVEIWDDDSGSPGSLITNGTSDTADPTGWGGTFALREFTWSGTLPVLTSGETYYFVIKHGFTLSTSNFIRVETANGAAGSTQRWKITSGGSESESADGVKMVLYAEGATNQWEATVSTDPRVVYFVTDDLYGEEKATSAEVTVAGDWHWASNTLTVYATSDPSDDIEVAARNQAVTTNGQSYLEFDNLAFDTALLYTAFVEGATASNINWTDCDFAKGFEFNFVTNSAHQADDCVVTRCTSKWAGASGFQLNGVRDNWLFQDCTSDRDCIVDPAFDRGSTENDWGAGFKIVSDRTLDEITNIVIDGCTVTNAAYKPTDDTPAHASQKGYGFWVDLVQASSGNENIVRNSTAIGCKSAGFFNEKSDYSIFHHIVAVGNGQAGLMVGGRLDPNPPPTRNNKFYHVTLYGNVADNGTNFDQGNLHVAGGYSASGNQVSDNEFFNIITFAAGETSEAVFEFGGENDGTLGSNNRYEFLTLGAEANDFVEWANNTFIDTYSAWDTAYQASTGAGIDELHYQNGNPTFTDAPDDLTLQSGSVGIDDGVAISGINDGFSGSAPDLGAFEFLVVEIPEAAGTITGDGSLAAVGYRSPHADSQTVGEGSLSAVGHVTPEASGSTDADGSLNAVGHVSSQAAGTVQAEGSLTAVGHVDVSASGSIAGEGSLSAEGQVAAQSSGTVVAEGSLSAVGFTSEAAQASGSVGAEGSLTAEGRTTPKASASVSAEGSLSAVGHFAPSSSGSVAAVGFLTGVGYVVPYTSGVVTAIASLSAVGRSRPALFEPVVVSGGNVDSVVIPGRSTSVRLPGRSTSVRLEGSNT